MKNGNNQKKGWIKEEHKNISIFNKNATFF